jgi:hypothetical protein
MGCEWQFAIYNYDGFSALTFWSFISIPQWCQGAQVVNAIILKKNKLKKKGHYEGAKSPK